MKKLSTYLFLILFSFQTPSQADDISDFQIEGMSIGDSALDYFTKEKIIENTVEEYLKTAESNKKFAIAEFYLLENFKTYQTIQIIYKINDKKYIIQGIEGIIFYRENIEDCYKKHKEISKELDELFSKEEKIDSPKSKHPVDKSGKSFTKDIYYKFNSGEFVGVSCYDWSKDIQYVDHLRIAIRSKKYNEWLGTL